MMRRHHQIIGLAAMLTLVGTVHLSQVQLDQARAALPRFEQFRYLPSGEYLRIATLGYEQVAADLLWLRAIQVMGERKVTVEDGRWLYHVLDVVTTLDLKFVQAYEAGGLALCTIVVLPDESNALLEKGMKHNPDVWQLPFYLGINYYFEFGDDEKAGEYMARAAHLPGAPEFIALFSARLYASSRKPQAAIDVLAQLYEQTKDESLKRALELRLKETIVERDLQLLEEAIFRYSEQYKRVPDRLDELIGPGLLSSLPLDPFGGTYLYNPTTQAVRSSSVDRRMQVRGKRRVK